MAKKTKAKKSVAKKSVSKKPAAKKKANPVPKGYHTVSPHMIVKDCAKAIDWYVKAFGAKALSRMAGPDGRIMHAEIRIGDSIVMLTDEFPEQGKNRRAPTSIGASTSGLMLYVKDVDAWFKRAVAQGATVTQPVADQFWGDRYGQMVDPYGHTWAIATRKVDMTPKQMQKAMDDMMKQMAPQQAAA